ncbi:MAG: DUF6133 family protein, partial [Clostridiales bacterium]|nr:DUF6133 family protein [Clostridiales bacterium]
MMKILMNKANLKANHVLKTTKKVMADTSGEGFIDSAVFSVLHCYDRITTIRKRVNNSMIKGEFKADKLIKKSRAILTDQRGEGTIQQAISILISVVLGSLLLMGLYSLFENIILPTLQNKIIDMFN